MAARTSAARDRHQSSSWSPEDGLELVRDGAGLAPLFGASAVERPSLFRSSFEKLGAVFEAAPAFSRRSFSFLATSARLCAEAPAAPRGPTTSRPARIGIRR